MSRSDWYNRPVEQTETTTIWRDGVVLRTDRFGRTRELRSVPPVDGEVDEPLDAEVML